jgi:copper chaperone
MRRTAHRTENSDDSLRRARFAICSRMSTKLQITGMTCQHCVRAVERALAAVPGVTRVQSIDLGRGEAIVEGEVEAKLLVGAVLGEGYQATVAS